jgi:alpha-tubulin suppressor-like RCC1 family protein
MKAPHQSKLACLLFVALLSAATGGAQTVTKIAGGDFFSLFLKSDGSLWSMGYNAHGELGIGNNFNTNRPQLVMSSNVTAIAAGDEHGLFLMNGGSLWAMGYNLEGELGDGNSDDGFYYTNRPELIEPTNVTAVAGGYEYSLFLKKDGTRWGMGYNLEGQLGNGTQDDSNVLPLPLTTMTTSNVMAIAAGYYHSLFVKANGSLWAMGLNGEGQLGDGGGQNPSDNNVTNAEQIVGSGVTAIAAGNEHSLFLKSDGSLWAMGNNDSGQLGDGSTNNAYTFEEIEYSNVVAIAAGGDHSMFLKNDGSLWVMGSNDAGQLGDNSSDGGLYFTNRPEMIVPSGVTAIAAGYSHSLFIKSDGSLWAMGLNLFGQLGDGTANFASIAPEQIVPVSSSPPGYNNISAQLLSSGTVRMSFIGLAGTNYALDRTFNLSPANWMPQVTNPAGAGGVLVFTNTPNKATNNFWRIRYVP